MVTRLGDDAKSWAVSLGLHGLLFLIMLAWIVQSPPAPLPAAVELLFSAPPAPEPEAQPARPQERVSASPAVARMASTPAAGQRTAASPQRAQSAAPRSTATPRSVAATRSAASTADRRAQAAPGAPGAAARQGNATAPPAQPRNAANAADRLPPADAKSSSAGVAAGGVTAGGAAGGAAGGTGGGAGQVRDNPASNPAAGAGTVGDAQNRASTGGNAGSAAAPSASISWGDGAARSRIAGRMPAFPRDVNREAQIRVRFTVHPDGSLGAMTVLQKGEPRFEQAALAAMGSWRFNALPAGAEQRDQTGVATFNFRLR